ncbi:MAG: hypothetical protein RLZZ299_2488 [Pseudomonadota bacterium]|jgi:acyl-CoA thioesterase FadM
MNLWLRMVVVLLRAAWRAPIGVVERGTIPFRVMPGDLDVNGHVNNGRYLTLMDLGRLDLTVRSGLWRLVVRRRWMPVVAGAMVRFKRELRLGATARLHTRVVGWDERWFWLEHRIESGERLAAVALLRACFKGPDGTVPAADVARAMGFQGPSPELPEAALRFADAERALA